MHKFTSTVDICNRTLAKVASVCAIVMMFCQVFSVVARYVFSYGIISVQEAVIYGHATLFLLGAAFLLQMNEHVRVDIFYGMMRAKHRRIVDIVAMLAFVLPVCGVIAWSAWTYVARSWGTLEGSPQSGGIPALFLLKSGILIFAISIALQAISIVAKLIDGNVDTAWNAKAAERE